MHNIGYKSALARKADSIPLESEIPPRMRGKVSASRNHLRGVLDSSLGGCQNYRAFGFTIIRHLQFSSLLYFISAIIFSKFSSCK